MKENLNNAVQSVISQMQISNNDLQSYEQYCDLYALYKRIKKDDGVCLGLLSNSKEDIKILNGVNVISGMTGHGKSMFANSIAYRGIIAEKNICYISLEITKENIFYQMLSIKSFIDNPIEEKIVSHSTIKKRELTPKQENYVFNELWPSFKNMKGNLHVLTEQDFDTNSFRSLVHKLMQVEEYSIKQTGHGIDMLIVDYIQLFKQYSDDNSGGTSEYTVIGKWVNDFRRLSLNYLAQKREIPVILVSQLNRDAWKDETKRLQIKMQNESNDRNKSSIITKAKQRQVPEVTLGLSQIAGSTEVAKAASQILTIYSDESLKISHQCKIQVLKNRDGACREDAIITYMNPAQYFVGSVDWEKERVCDVSLAGLFADTQSGPIDLNNLESEHNDLW